MKRHVTIGAMVIGLALSSCGGDGEKPATSPAPTDTAEAPAASAPAPGALPPEFLKCMADRGVDVEQGADIHSAPQQVLEACFGALHGGAP
jgi:hypothetical protein